MNTLNTALELYHKGIATIPIKPHSKHAAIAWREYQNRAPDISELLSWFAGNDTLNIAVLCGPVSNNLAILDFDDLSAYEEWRLNHPQYARSFSVSTSRGMHVYLFADMLPDKTFKANGADIKVSGYCLTFPSIHPSGARYEIMNNAPIMRILDLPEVGLTPSIEVIPSHITTNNCSHIGTLNVSTLSNTRRQGSTISRIKALVPITSLFPNYQRSGDGKAIAHCPMSAHVNGDRNPSLSLDLKTNRAQCLKPGCPLHQPRGGDVIDTYAILHGLTFKQAIGRLAGELGL